MELAVGQSILSTKYNDYLCQSKWDLVICLTNVPQHQVVERAERAMGADGGARIWAGARLGCDPLRRSHPLHFGLRSSEHSHRLGLDRFIWNFRSDSNLLVSGPRYRYASAADELLLRFTFDDLLLVQPV